MPLIVTRPAAQAAAWLPPLHALGVHAVALPLIDIAGLQDPAQVRAAWAALPQCALAMFVSANAVQHFFAAAPAGSGWPAGVLAGSTGPGTSAALRAGGVPESALVQPAADAAAFDSEALWQCLQSRPWSGRRVLVVRGDGGRDWLADHLRCAGAAVQFVTAYRRLPPQLGAAGRSVLQAACAAQDRAVWHFSSSESIGHLVQLGRQLQVVDGWARAVALATHARIAQSATHAGFGEVHHVGPTPSDVARWMHAHKPLACTAMPLDGS